MRNVIILTLILISFGASEAFPQANVGNTNNSANTSANNNNSASKSNVRQGQILIAIGSAIPFGGGAYLIVMGISELKQGKAQSDSAQGAGRTASDSAYNASQYGNTFDSAAYKDAMNKGTDYLNKNGYTVKDNKITTPDGKSFGLDQMTNNAGDMAALTGMDKDQIQKALDEMNKVAKEDAKKASLDKLKAQSAKLDNSSGGSGAEPASGGLGLSGLIGVGGIRAPTSAQTEGLKKYLGSDAIGIAQDDIFKMVQRRYQEKDRAEFFSK